jgi:hypothetical protein
LDSGDARFWESWRFVDGEGILGVFAILFGRTIKWAVLGLAEFVLETLEEFFDVPGHGDIDMLVFVVPS